MTLALPIKRSGLALLGCAFVLMVALARFCPATVIEKGKISGPEAYVYRTSYLLEQTKDPLALIKTQSNDNNSNALRWRILFPYIAHVLGLRASTFLQLPRIGAGVLLATCALFLYRLTKDGRKALLGLVLVATSSAFLVGTDWITLDPWFLLLVLGFVFAENELAAVIAAVLAPWADERFLFFLLPFLFLRHSLRPVSRTAGIWIFFSAALYVMIRLVAALQGETSVSLQLSNQAQLEYPVLRGWYFAFGVGWLPVLYGMGIIAVRLWSKQKPSFSSLYLVSLAGALGALAYLAGDTTRSIAVCLPFLLQGITLAPTRVVLGLAALAISLPTACYVYGDCRYMTSCFSW
jgi:hypothetical protein